MSTHSLSRRAALRAAGASIAALTVAACATGTGPVTSDPITQLVTDTQLAVTGLQGVLPALLAVIPAGAGGSIQKDLGLAASFLPDLASFTNVTAASGTVAKIVAALSDALSIAGTPPISLLLPPPVGMAIMAAQVLLPIISGIIGQAGALPVRAGAPTPDRAREILRAAARAAA